MQLLKGFWTMSICNYFLGIFPWTILFIFFQHFGIRFYHLRNKDQCKRIQKKISHRCTHFLDENEGAGFAIGFWYIANIKVTKSEYGDYYDIWLVTNKKTFESLTRNEHDVKNPLSIGDKNNSPTTLQKEEEKVSIQIYDRTGSYQNPYFNKRTVYFFRWSFHPNAKQQYIIDEILDHKKNHMTTVAYIHGKTGTGKSIIGLLLAKILKTSYCNTLQPWIPGDSISNLYDEIEPTSDNPLVLVFDEIDIALEKIHKGIPAHMNVTTRVQDKIGWNRMMDDINWGLYPHMILLLISNQSPKVIQSLDPSYIRKGRVNLYFSMD